MSNGVPWFHKAVQDRENLERRYACQIVEEPGDAQVHILLQRREVLRLREPDRCRVAVTAGRSERQTPARSVASETPESERGVRWDDSVFNIEWPILTDIAISEKDRNWPDFAIS